MMRLGRRATLLVAFYLLTAAATAYAECAWVLWTNLELVNSSMPSEWGIVKAVATRQDCIAAMRKMYNQVRAGTTTANDDIEGGSFLVITRDRSASTAGKCLPDTVDPRGPKGR
jgi:hypothetical protein